MKKPNKGLINEVLPDPKQAARDLGDGSPRDRTMAHLRRIVAAAAAASLPLAGALADNSVPGGKKDDKKGTAEGSRPSPPPPDLRYGVVDPMPAPYINKAVDEGTLRIESSSPGCTVLVDGTDVGKTPIKKFKTTAGMHAITVTTPDGQLSKNTTVEVKPKATAKVLFDMRPPKPHK
jgi:PEGA domain